MNLAIQLIILIAGIILMLLKGKKQLNYFIAIILLISSNLLLSDDPHISSHYFFVLCYFSVIFFVKRKILFDLPLKAIWILYFIGFAIIAVNGLELSTFSKLYKPISTFCKTYLLLWIGFYVSTSFKFKKSLAIVLFIVTIYGLLIYLFKADPIRAILQPDFDRSYYFGVRNRVASTWSHPIAYGFVCSVLFIVYFNAFKKSVLTYSLLGLLAFNVLICGSRTDLLCLLIMIGVYVLLSRKGSRRFQTVLLLGLLCITVYLVVPPVTSKVNELVQVMLGSENTEGSTLSMRREQWQQTLLTFREFPITGGGFDYVQEGLGYGNDIDWQYWTEYSSFHGFESYIFIILIERGLIGALIELMVLISLFVWFFSHRKYSSDYSAKGMSILLGFYLFSIMTGCLDTWTIAMLFVGIYMGKLYCVQHSRLLKPKKETSTEEQIRSLS